MGNNSSSDTTSARRPPRVPFREWEDVDGTVSGSSNHQMATTSRNVCYLTSTSNTDSVGIQFENASALDLEQALCAQEEEDELAEIRYDDEESGENPSTTAGVTAKSVESPEHSSNDNKGCRLKLYNSSDVTLEDNPIGDGKFGKVFRATIRPGKHQTVIPFSLAVKEFKCPFDSRNSIRQLGAIMRLKHRNVVTVLGILEDSNYQSVSVEDRTVCPRVLLQYFPEGNLLQYLSHRHNPQDYPTLVKLALDIVQGCDYLHSNNVIHGNLAGRNILVEKQNGKGNFLTYYNAKVSDHIEQLFKAKEPGIDYVKVPNGTLLPVRSIRWVPHELVDEDNSSFSFQSDVWSFGVVLWEILTKGSVPYGRKADNERVLELIRSGQSPLSIRRPEGFPEEIIHVLKRIFIVNATNRPSFSELKKEFISLSTSAKSLDMGNKYKNYPGLNKPRSLTMRKYASDAHESRNKLKAADAEAYRGRRPRGHRGFGDDSSPSSTREPTESFSVKKSEEQNVEVNLQFPKEKSKQPQPPTLRESMVAPHQNPRAPMPPRGLGRENALPRRGVYPHLRHHALSYPNSVAPHSNVGSFAVPMKSSILSPPPPPYTPNPLPRHSVVGGSRAGVGSRYEKSRDRMLHRADDRRDIKPSCKVSIEEEIKQTQNQLERLKMIKLQVEASTITNRLQNVMSEMAELKGGGAPALPSSQFSAESANRLYERSCGIQPRSSHPLPDRKIRGRRRSSSRGRIRDFSKMAPVTRNYPQENAF